LDIQKRLKEEMKQNAQDDRYINKTFNIYSGRNGGKDFGNVSFSTDFNDETVSAIVAFLPMLNELAGRFNIPRLRGFKTITSAAANQGDGVMGISPHTFNFHASGLAYSNLDAEERKVRIQNHRDIINDAESERETNQAKLIELIDKHGTERNMIDNAPEDHKAYKALSKRQEELYEEKRTSLLAIDRLKPKATKEASTWKLGDPTTERPSHSEGFYDNGLDIIKNILLHEFGHHVHQYFAQEAAKSNDTVELKRAAGIRPVERWMLSNKSTFLNKLNKDKQATKYATKNQVEWFAENFALYWNNRRDLVDPMFVSLLESILGGTFSND